MIKKYLLTALIALLSFTAFSQLTTKELAKKYISNFSTMAVREMKRSKVPASITLAQGMLESGYAQSDLAKETRNHFGIKCGKDWTADKYYYDDDAKDECFRKYDSVEDSYADHSEFLSSRDRYAFLFELPTTDYKGWANGLKRAGYATDPNYPTRLIKIIEDNNLTTFDSDTEGVVLRTVAKSKTKSNVPVASAKSRNPGTDEFVVDPFYSHDVKYNNGVKYIVIKEGDSFERISQEFGLKSWEIVKYNDLGSSQTIADLTYIYIAPKKCKANKAHLSHTVKKGDTLYSISNKYGVKLKRLIRFNRMSPNSTLKEGDVINLRSKKSATTIES